MTTALIIAAYLILGMISAAILKRLDPREFEYDGSFMFAVVILWPLFVMIGIVYVIVKLGGKIIDGIGFILDRIVETSLPRVRWK